MPSLNINTFEPVIPAIAEFHNEFSLNKHAPIKYKFIRASNSSYMTKSLMKEIILRSRLCKKFVKTKTQESMQLYNKQQNLCELFCVRPKKLALLSWIIGF